jgi:hypothetical protein
MDPEGLPPARDPQLAAMNTIPPEKDDAAPQIGNPNIPPPPPNLLKNLESPDNKNLIDPASATAEDPKAAATNAAAGKGAAGPKKPNFFDEWKTKLLGTNKQSDRAKINQGLDEFDFTHTFKEKLFDQPMLQFYNYLLDEEKEETASKLPPPAGVPQGPQLPAMPSSGDQPAGSAAKTPEVPKKEEPEAVAKAVEGKAEEKKPEQPGAPQPSGDAGLGESQPKLEEAMAPPALALANKVSSQPVLDTGSKPAVPAADKTKVPRYYKRIDLNFRMRTDVSYQAGVTDIITSPDGKYAVVICDYYQAHLFVDLTQPGDKYMAKKENWDSLKHYEWTRSKHNKYLPVKEYIESQDKLDKDFERSDAAERFKGYFDINDGDRDKLHLRKSWVQFFPDSSKIAFLESNRLILNIYDVQEVATNGWSGKDSLIKSIPLLETSPIKDRAVVGNEIFGIKKSDLNVPVGKQRYRRFVPIIFFYFEKLAIKGNTFDCIEQDTLMIGTTYGFIRIVIPKSGIFLDPANDPTEPDEEEDDAPANELQKKEEKKPKQNREERWFTILDDYIQVFCPTYISDDFEEYMKELPESVGTFNNHSGIHGWVHKENGFKTVIPFELNWRFWKDEFSYGQVVRKNRNTDLYEPIKTSKVGFNTSVFCESTCPGEFGLLTFDTKKGEVIKITKKGSDTLFRQGKRVNLKSAIIKDDCKILLTIDENGKASLYTNINKSYAILDNFEMKLESFQGKKDDVVGVSHYYANTQILDNYSAVVFANNSSLFIYDINLPAPSHRYYLETIDVEMRPYTPHGPNWFMLRGEDYYFSKTKAGETSRDVLATRIIDFDKKVKIKVLATNVDAAEYSERTRMRREFRELFEATFEGLKKSNEDEQNQDSDSNRKSVDHEVAQKDGIPESQQLPKVNKNPFLNKFLFQFHQLFPVSMGDQLLTRSENSGKSLGNSFGLQLSTAGNNCMSQFVPGSSTLELFAWASSFYYQNVVIGLRDYSTCKPLKHSGAFTPPEIKWELLFDRTGSGGGFKWDGQDIGSFFKFDPTGKIAAFTTREPQTDYRFAYLFMIETGKTLFKVPLEFMSQIISESEVILTLQEWDEDAYSDNEASIFFKKFLKPNLAKFMEENRKRKPVIWYDFVADKFQELYTIKDYTQQPIDINEQMPYMFFNSQMLPLDIPQPPKQVTNSPIQPTAPKVALLLKPNLISLIRYNDIATQKQPVVKIQKIWEDSTKKINYTVVSKDGSVVFSPGNLWMAYYDESTLDAIRVMWTPTLDFAKFQAQKGEETEQLKFSLKGIKTLRMCFSDDNRYLIIKAGKKLTLYNLQPPILDNRSKTTPVVRPPRAYEISDIESSELASSSNIVSMKFRKGQLDIAYVRDLCFFFESIPFDFDLKNMYLKSLRNKLLTYQYAAGKEKQKAAQEICSIMMQQPLHQKYSDSTYLKILSAFKRTTPLIEYLNAMVKTPHIIFQFSPYRQIVEYTNGTRATNRVIESLIDFVVKCVDDNNELPIYDTDVLLSWLREKLIENNGLPEYEDGKMLPKKLEPIKISIQYKRRLLELITLAPTNRTILGELRHIEKNVAQVTCSYAEKEKFPVAIERAKKTLMDENSANSVDFNSYFTAFPFDLNNGSKFSLDYFTWLEDVSDEDLVNKYAGIIYYKWSLVLKPAVIYSIFFWVLNGALCAFMGFSYKTVWLGVVTMVLHALFILYEFKCYIFAFIESIKDPWNYVDITAHLFSLLSVGMLLNYRNQIDTDRNLFSQLSWLRMISFSLITFRSLGLFRIFSGTRYLIVMIFAVFKEIAIFLSVFGYMIFIYWFVCLVRPSLVPNGKDETFYNSITQSLDIAFSNFNGADLSWIVLISTIFGQIILGLVLLNYLIAIVSKTHEKVSERRSLYDIRILLSIIKEFDSFFYMKKNAKETIDPLTASTYITVIALQEQSIQVKKLKDGLRVQEAEQGNSKLMADLDNIKSKVSKSLFELKKKIDTMGTKLDIEVRDVLKKRKKKQANGMKGLPDVLDACKEGIINKVKEVKINAESKGQRNAEEVAKLKIAELQAQAAAKQSQKKLDEASKEASRVLNNEDEDSDDDHESMEQIDEADEDNQEGSDEEDKKSQTEVEVKK